MIVVGVPIAAAVWIVRAFARRARRQDEILARLVALEEKRASTSRPSND